MREPPLIWRHAPPVLHCGTSLSRRDMRPPLRSLAADEESVAFLTGLYTQLLPLFPHSVRLLDYSGQLHARAAMLHATTVASLSLLEYKGAGYGAQAGTED